MKEIFVNFKNGVDFEDFCSKTDFKTPGGKYYFASLVDLFPNGYYVVIKEDGTFDFLNEAPARFITSDEYKLLKALNDKS